jgi:hypothetical protein
MHLLQIDKFAGNILPLQVISQLPQIKYFMLFNRLLVYVHYETRFYQQAAGMGPYPQ